MAQKKEIVEITSISVLESLERKQLMRYLRKVSKDEERYPVYLFKKTDKVKEYFENLHPNGFSCERSIDEEAWQYYKQNVLNAEKPLECIVTRNYKVVHRIFKEGYACMLCKTGRDQYKRKFFVFYKNDVIESIKNEEDEKRKTRYEERQIKRKAEETSKTDMGKLIEKAMEEKAHE